MVLWAEEIVQFASPRSRGPQGTWRLPRIPVPQCGRLLPVRLRSAGASSIHDVRQPCLLGVWLRCASERTGLGHTHPVGAFAEQAALLLHGHTATAALLVRLGANRDRPQPWFHCCSTMGLSVQRADRLCRHDSAAVDVSGSIAGIGTEIAQVTIACHGTPWCFVPAAASCWSRRLPRQGSAEKTPFATVRGALVHFSNILPVVDWGDSREAARRIAIGAHR
jgi:hypothetical protein